MRRSPTLFALAAVLVVSGSISGPGPAGAAWPHDPYANLPIYAGPSMQHGVVAISDGAGGAYVAWQGNQNGNYDIYLQRLLGDGTVAAGWPPLGQALCAAAGDQLSPTLVGDGSGGVFVGWQDRRGVAGDPYVQRVLASGAVAPGPGWVPNGRPLSVDAANQGSPVMCADGSGGVIGAWSDNRGAAPNEIYAQHLDAAGNLVAGWPVDGLAVGSGAGDQNAPAIDSDYNGGAVIAWQDSRAGVGLYDIYLSRITGAGGVPAGAGWTANGNVVCAAPGSQQNPSLSGDGGGGAYVAWQDLRGADLDIYVGGLTSLGGPGALWPVDGVAMCAAAGNQTTPRLADYGQGVLACWEDFRWGANSEVFCHAISNYGVLVAQWPVDGYPVCTAAFNQREPRPIADGAGGVYIAWYDYRTGNPNTYVQRIGPDYTLSAGWPTDGLVMTQVNGTQGAAFPVLDANEGVMVFWNDYRSGNWDIYGQRVDRFARLGNPEPSIVKVRDIPNDQGGRVRLDWDASYLDVSPRFEVESYAVWRQIPAGAALVALRDGARRVGSAAEARLTGERSIRATTHAGQTAYWEYVTSLPARGLPSYSYTASTQTDSTGSSNRLTWFMVEADDAASIAFWMSAPDSGYSVDNIAPAAAMAFTAQYFAGGAPVTSGQPAMRGGDGSRAERASSPPFAWLHWSPSTEPDFLEYRVYRGSSADFPTDASHLVVTKSDTGYVDLGAPPSFYKLLVADRHGNFSVASSALPANVLGAGAASQPGVASFASPRPNPVRFSAQLRFELPVSSPLTLAIYDASGRRVRAIARGPFEAGSHDRTWDRRDDAGHVVRPGMYFARLELPGRTLVQRLAVLD